MALPRKGIFFLDNRAEEQKYITVLFGHQCGRARRPGSDNGAYVNFAPVDFVGLAACCVSQAASLLRQPRLMLRCLTFVAPSESGLR